MVLPDGGPLLKLRRNLGLVFAATAFLSFLSAAAFMFSLMAGTFTEIARSAAADPAGAEFARMIANDRMIRAAGRVIAFLLAQAAIQVAALVLSTRMSWRGIEAEFARMQKTIGDQRKRLEEAAALSAWKEVASFLGHQLKNPLAAVGLAAANAAEAFSRSGCTDQRMCAMVSDSLRAIGEESTRMTEIVSRLKSLTAFQEPRFAPQPLADLLRRAASRHGPSALSLSIEGDAVAQVDAELLVQALVNMLNNSVEAGQDDPPVRVKALIGSGPGGISLHYADSCRLHDPAMLVDLGRKRSTTKATGSGLGLLFASRIMSLHGGSLQTALGAEGGLEIILLFPSPEAP